MVLLASSYDQSRFLKAADLGREKKFRIKSVTEEMVGTEQKDKKLVVWFTNDERVGAQQDQQPHDPRRFR